MGLLVVWACIVTVYVTTHSFPSGKGGFYFVMARELVANGFVYPVHLDSYIVQRIPYAFPPIGIYLYAIGLELGVSVPTLGMAVPALFLGGIGIAVVVFVVEFTDDFRAAWFAGVLAITHPLVLRQHLVATGSARNAGLIGAFLTVALARRTMRTDRRRLAVIAGLAWGVTILSHPVFTYLAALGVLVVYERERADGEGLVTGVTVAAVGLAVGAPWLGHVLLNHGPLTLFEAGISYHEGPLLNWDGFVDVLLNMLPHLSQFYTVAALFGVTVLVRRRSWGMIGWFTIVGLPYPHSGGLSAIAATVGGVGWATVATRVDNAVASLRGTDGSDLWPQVSVGVGSVVVALVVATAAIGFGGSYAAANVGLHDIPEFVSDDDVRALEALAAEPDAPVAAPRRVQTWVPVIAGSPTLATSKGTEWVSGDGRTGTVVSDKFSSVGSCTTADCYVANATGDIGTFDVYLNDDPTAAAEFADAPRFTVIYDQDGIVIARFDPSGAGQRDRLSSDRSPVVV